MLAWLAVYADQAILLLYGNQWGEAGTAARALAVAAMASAPFFISREMFFALGETRRSFYIDLLAFVVRAITLLATAPYGIAVMALGLFLPNVVYTAASQRAVARMLAIPLAAIVRTAAAPFVISLLYGALMLFTRETGLANGVSGPLPILLLSAGVTAVAAPLLLHFSKSPLIESLKSFRRGR